LFRACRSLPGTLRHASRHSRCREPQPNAATKQQIITRPARSRSCRLGDGVQPPEASHELFRDWQETLTQSSVKVQGPDTLNGCLVLRHAATPAERLNRELMMLQDTSTRSPTRERTSLPHLTKTYHGGRQTAPYSPEFEPDIVLVEPQPRHRTPLAWMILCTRWQHNVAPVAA
jgi:hypothetical protein